MPWQSTGNKFALCRAIATLAIIGTCILLVIVSAVCHILAVDYHVPPELFGLAGSALGMMYVPRAVGKMIKGLQSKGDDNAG